MKNKNRYIFTFISKFILQHLFKKCEKTNYKDLNVLIQHILEGCKFLHLLLLNKIYLIFLPS